MTFTIRPAIASDAPAVAALHVATWKETYARLLPVDFADEAFSRGRREMWERVLRDPAPGWTVRLAESEGAVVGFAVSGPGSDPDGGVPPRARQLHSLYVAADRHGTGAGQALLDAVLGGDPAMLWVAKENPRAIAFYRRNGFEFDGAEGADPGTPTLVGARMVR